mmetsp:Transcript_15035/g.43416  ORF Transcript_15035/g.43416 Transcript_15035/m.43416 type:complete len:297 (+) Transcript_15035:2328-3218(+)
MSIPGPMLRSASSSIDSYNTRRTSAKSPRSSRIRQLGTALPFTMIRSRPFLTKEHLESTCRGRSGRSTRSGTRRSNRLYASALSLRLDLAPTSRSNSLFHRTISRSTQDSSIRCKGIYSIASPETKMSVTCRKIPRRDGFCSRWTNLLANTLSRRIHRLSLRRSRALSPETIMAPVRPLLPPAQTGETRRKKMQHQMSIREALTLSRRPEPRRRPKSGRQKRSKFSLIPSRGMGKIGLCFRTQSLPSLFPKSRIIITITRSNSGSRRAGRRRAPMVHLQWPRPASLLPIIVVLILP